MPNKKNIEELKELSDSFSKAKAVYFTEFHGLNVGEITRLRSEFFKADIQFKVVKNTLVKLKNGEAKIHKDLSIKSLKCKNSKFDDNPEITAYVQVKDLKAGQVELRVESNGIVHVSCGKISFRNEQLVENIAKIHDTIMKVRPSSVKGQYLEKIFISSTMGPSVIIDHLAIG